MKRGFVVLLVFLFLISSVHLVSSVVSCDILPPDITYESGTTTEQQTTFRCSNPANSSTVDLSKGGTGLDYFDLDSTTLSSPSNNNSIPDSSSFW